MRFAEFFAGIGLMRLGLERAGWTCVFANDIDPAKREMYLAQFPGSESHFALGDIRGVSAAHIPPVELATASFPCTDLSLAGGRAGLSGSQSSALWPFLELLDKLARMRPRLVMLENVPGLLTSHGGGDFKSLLTHLNALGYVVDAFIVDAAHFVPQSRARLFVVAKLGPAEPGKGIDSARESQHRPAQLVRFIRGTWDDIAWSLTRLPALPERKTTVADVLEVLADDAPEWWSVERTEYLLDQMSERHRATAQAMIDGERSTVGTVFRRVRNGRSMAELRTDGTAGCLRTPKGGSGRQILFVAGGGRARARLLTPRECARLMGADDFVIDVPPNQALFGFGDAVCVPVIEWIAEQCLSRALAPRPAVEMQGPPPDGRHWDVAGSSAGAGPALASGVTKVRP